MSQHLDTPSGSGDSRLDIADLYVFDAEGATVLVMNLRTTVAAGDPPDAFHPAARYEFRIHFDHHERESLAYRLSFLPAQQHSQPFTVERLTAPGAGHDAAAGTLIASGLTGQEVVTRDGGQVWAGPAVDPFYLDLRQLSDIDDVVRRGADVDLTRWARGTAEDSYAGSTVSSIVLTVPVGSDGLTTGRQIGTWATTRLATDDGGWQQVARSGLPLICEIFRPLDRDGTRQHQQSHPAEDAAAYGPEVADLVASTVAQLGTSDRPGAYADSVMERIVPDVLRYVVGSPAAFGFARFNGRRLADNAAEVVLSLATNSAVATGLRAADVRRSQETFPFVLPV